MMRTHWQRFAAQTLLLSVTATAALPATTHAAKCGGVEVSSALDGFCKDTGSSTNPIFALASAGIYFFSSIFGLLLVLVVVISGIQYITSAGSGDGVKEAKQRLQAAVTGLVLFVLMFAILQILLPPNARLFR